MLHRILAAAIALPLLFAASSSAPACPFCPDSERGPTLIGDYDEAAMVLLGNFANPKLEGGTTDFIIERVIKDHPAVKNKTDITLPRYINQLKSKFLVFCDVYKDNLDPFRGIQLPEKSEMVKYLTGAVALAKRPAPDRLRYAFDFLQSPEIDIATDAYREFAKADYFDYKDMAVKLPADTIAGWLRDPKTAPYRYGLYASLLGHCGNAEHAKLLRDMIDHPDKRKGSGIDGLLFGYAQLAPKDAWAYLQKLLTSSDEEFLMRFAGLRTLRFLWDLRPDLVDRKDLVKGFGLVLQHGDMADFAIEDLRKYERWETTKDVLGLSGQKSHDAPVVKRAILRFALQAAMNKTPEAIAFVAQQRKANKTYVDDTEEILKLDLQLTPKKK